MLQRLCNGDSSAPLVMEVFDWDSDGSHDLIGECALTVKQLLDSVVSRSAFAVINPKKASKKSYTNSGTLSVVSATIFHVPTFLEYIQGGCGMYAPFLNSASCFCAFASRSW
ncbi:MAG: hypothetical protein EOO65_04645 [Methanosarcinales archaeon]|nr:MAG: hypothetical protein EOO65_04645 [Methanosarcinales archaeon]